MIVIIQIIITCLLEKYYVGEKTISKIHEI